MHDTINEQQRLALGRVRRLLIEAADAAYNVARLMAEPICPSCDRPLRAHDDETARSCKARFDERVAALEREREPSGIIRDYEERRHPR